MIIVPSKGHQVTTHLKAVDEHTYSAGDEILAMRSANILNEKYPGHLWGVFVDSEDKGGVMVIKNFSISYRYGYTLHLSKIDHELKRVVHAGGEMLERAKMKRGSWDGQQAKHIDGVADKHQPIPELGIII